MTTVSACHICLSVDTEVHKITECNLVQTFLALLGNKTSVWRPFLACAWCRAQLASCASLRARCRRAQALLRGLLAEGNVTAEDLRTLDRVAEKLTLNLKINNVYNSDSTQTEKVVKIEEIKLETVVTENIFVDEPFVGNCDDANDTNHKNFEEVTAEDVKDKKISTTIISINTARRSKGRKSVMENDLPVKGENKRKEGTSNKKNKNDNNGEKAKRIIRRRVADNGFLPDFNFEEFESKYDVKIDILSEEEQMREMEARKMSSNTLSPFGCEICGKAFATKQVYDVHMWKHSAGAGAFECDVCRVRFSTRSRARVHHDAHRLRFTCVRCAYVARTRTIAKNHYLSHTGMTSTHKCPHCEAVFNKYTSYLTHVRRRHPSKNAVCDECGETFVGATGLRHHKTRSHRKAVRPQFECGCGALFSNSVALARHRASAKDNTCDTSLRPCFSCGEGFSSDEALQTHEATHTTEKHPCTECNKTFVDARSYDTHVARVHLNIRVKEPPRVKHTPKHGFICEQCGIECTSLTNLVAHQRSHSGAKPHACPACGQRFGSRHNMQRHHKVIHLNQRSQVKCTICGKVLAHASSLKFHVNTVHLKMPLPPRQRRRKDK